MRKRKRKEIHSSYRKDLEEENLKEIY